MVEVAQFLSLGKARQKRVHLYSKHANGRIDLVLLARMPAQSAFWARLTRIRRSIILSRCLVCAVAPASMVPCGAMSRSVSAADRSMTYVHMLDYHVLLKQIASM